MNATPTSFSPSSPAFVGTSTSSPFLGGVYSGANGDNTLTVHATVGGIVGVTPIQLEVRNNQDEVIDTVNLGLSPAGETFALSNGLEVSFSSGSIQFGDSFEFDVWESVGSSIRPDNPFDQIGDAGPGFESGFQVVSGSFDVNGVTISVSSSEALNAVLDRITASAAGVTASFDAATETVLLTQKTSGPSFDVVVENDTSGILAATKLDAASSVLGALDETELAISQVGALAGIQSGWFSVNGTALTVDVLQDSLADVISRINSSAADATAAFDLSTGRFSIARNGSNALVIEDGTSGLFSGLSVQEGVFSGTKAKEKTSFRNETAFRLSLSRFAMAYEDMLAGSVAGFGAATVTMFRKQLEEAVATTFRSALGENGSGTLRSGLGLDFASSRDSSRTLEVDQSGIRAALDSNGGELADFLFAEKQDHGYDGLVIAIGDLLDRIMGTLDTLLGPDAAGLRLDVTG